MCNLTKSKSKKIFCQYCLQCVSSEKILIKHRENCFIINRKETLKLKGGLINFKNHFKQLRFMLILNLFEKELKIVIKIILYKLKSIKIISLLVLLPKLLLLIINLDRFPEAILEEYYYCQK